MALIGLSAHGAPGGQLCGYAMPRLSLPQPTREDSGPHPGQDDYDLGIDHLLGRNGRRKDFDLATAAFRRAADLGMLPAYSALGTVNSVHRRTAQSLKEAHGWFSKLEQKNHPGGTFQLALMTKRGDGAPRDYGKALALLRKAAALGNEEAAVFLGDELSLEESRGEVLLREAKCWYSQVANENSYAQWRLGVMAEKGLGQQADLREAAKWYCLAVKSGVDKPVESVRRLSAAQGRNVCEN